jgi:hypothetical protein
MLMSVVDLRIGIKYEKPLPIKLTEAIFRIAVV